MTETILLCGEGPTDYGAPEYGTGKWREGPVQAIAGRIPEGPVAFEAVDKKDIKRLRVQGRGLRGHGVKAFKLCVIAKQKKLDKVICYVDADKTAGKGKKEKLAKESYQRVYDEISEGFRGFNASHDAEIRGIPMVPLRMIESWLMSDAAAFAACYGSHPTNPSLPSRPEFLWGGKSDPRSDYPKNVLRRILEQYPGKECTRETYNELARATSIETLRKRCPISFESFFIEFTRKFG